MKIRAKNANAPAMAMMIAPFALERFYTDTLVSELAAAAVSH